VKEQVMPGVSQGLSTIPKLGSGLGYRRELREAILESRRAIDFLEIVTEQFFGGGARIRELEEICGVFPVIPHGVGLSIGSVDLDHDYLRAIKRVSDVTASPYYSEHLAMTRAPGIDIGHLAPLWFSETVLRHTIDNVRRVQDYLQKPLVLENVTYTFTIPGAGMTQTEFFTRLVDATGCGVLLDVTNVYINSVNHQFDAVAFLKEMPLDSIVQIHLAGGYAKDGMLIDAHSERVDEGSWQLLDALTDLIAVRGSILEHDANFPEDITAMLDQLDRARRAIARPPAEVRLANPV
jgi:uncharacterized protein (UPF0276 family)